MKTYGDKFGYPGYLSYIYVFEWFERLKTIKVMVGVQKYTCGAGDGMFDDDNGSWVEVKEYNRLKEYVEELYELAYNNCRGLAHDELNEIIVKYEK